MSAEAKGVAVQKYKPKVTPHILDQIQGDSAARSNTVIHLSQDAVAHSKKLLSESRRALVVAQKLREKATEPKSSSDSRAGGEPGTGRRVAWRKPTDAGA